MAQQTILGSDFIGGNGRTKLNDNYTDLYTNKLDKTGGTLTGMLDLDGASASAQTLQDHQSYSEENPGITALRWSQRTGDPSTPLTLAQPSIKLQRVENLNSASMGGNPAQNYRNALISMTAKGLVTNFPQVVAIWAKAQGGGTTAGSDVCAINAVGTIDNSTSTSYGMAGYFEGRREVATGKSYGLEVTNNNATPTPGAYVSAGGISSDSVGLWVISRGEDNASGIELGFSGTSEWQNGFVAKAGSVLDNAFRDESSAAISHLINGTHATAALAIASGAGKVLIGKTAQTSASTVLEIDSTTTADPFIIAGRAAGTDGLSLAWPRNSQGGVSLMVAAGTNSFMQGVIVGDGMIANRAGGKSLHLGGTSSVVRIGQDNSLEFRNGATVYGSMEASTGKLTWDTNLLVADATNDEVLLGTATRDSFRFGKLFIRQDDHAKRGLQILAQVNNAGSGVVRHPRPLQVNVDFRRTDSVGGGSEALAFGVHSIGTFGGESAALPANGNIHGISSDILIVGNGHNNNEHAAYYGCLRYEIGTGFTQTAGPAGRTWFTDFNVHGPIAVQPHLMAGVTMFLNNHYNGAPVSGPSAAYWAVTAHGRGGNATSTHQAASTYPLDIGFGVIGRAGDLGSVNTRRGWEVGFKVGGYGSGWLASSDPIPTRVGTAFEANDWEDYGVRIRNRISTATGPALAVDAGNGAIVAGATAALNASELFEVRGPDAITDPLVMIGGTGFQRSYSMHFRNSAGILHMGIVGAGGEFAAGTIAGDALIRQTQSGKFLHLGGSTRVISISQANALGFHAATPIAKPSVSGSRAGNAALASLLTALANYGLVTDSSTA